MPSVTGTPSQVDAHLASGSTSVTVPSDATGAVAFWGHWAGNNGSTLNAPTLGANTFTVEFQLGEGTTPPDANGVGCGTLYNLPGTGSQTFAWAWSNAANRSEGGLIAIAWIKNHSSATRDVDCAHTTGINNPYSPISVDSQPTDLVLAFIANFSTNPSLDGSTTLLDNVALNNEVYDMTIVTAGSGSTAISASVSNYPAISGVSIVGVAQAQSTQFQARPAVIRTVA